MTPNTWVKDIEDAYFWKHKATAEDVAFWLLDDGIKADVLEVSFLVNLK